MKNWIMDNSIEISYQSTLMSEQLLNLDWTVNLNSLKVLYTAGDRLKVYSNNNIPFDLPLLVSLTLVYFQATTFAANRGLSF